MKIKIDLNVRGVKTHMYEYEVPMAQVLAKAPASVFIASMKIKEKTK